MHTNTYIQREKEGEYSLHSFVKLFIVFLICLKIVKKKKLS